MKRIYLLLVVLGMGAGIWAGLWSLMPPDGPDAVTVDAPTLEGVPVPSSCSIEATRIQDVSRINPAEVSVVCRPRAGSDWSRAEQQIRAVLAYARKTGLTVSMAGARHSQGGHISAPGGLLLDMSGYRGVQLGKAERSKRQVRVLSGTTWAEIQEAANGDGLRPDAYRKAMADRGPDGRMSVPGSLAVMVQQSSNIFTVGGSLSVNCHGRDKSFGPIISSVESFRIMLHDGRIITASRGAAEGSDEARLFAHAIGGFGLFGVILDVTLRLVDNVVVEKRVKMLDYTEYVSELRTTVLPDPRIQLHYGRLNIDALSPNTFLREMYTADFSTTEQIDGYEILSTEKNAKLLGSVMEVGEWSKRAKRLRWKTLLKKIDVPGRVTRMTLNNAMRPPVQFLLERRGKRSINILQEYFVPLDGFVAFIDGLRKVALQQNVNLQNVTLRYVAGNDRAALSYAPEEAIAVVLYINVALDPVSLETSASWTRDLVDLALQHGGRYYLAYQRWPSVEQLRRSYPEIDAFLKVKREFDPEGRFRHQFYTHYFEDAAQNKSD